MAVFNDNILPFHIAQFPQTFLKRLASSVWTRTKGSEKSYPRASPRLLLGCRGKAKRKKQGANRNTENAFLYRFTHAFRLTTHAYLITRSALARTLGGMVKPICCAVLRLMTSSNFVGCSTGISAGLDPLRILSIWMAARRITSSLFSP